jgi:hypothetical protein
MKDGEMIAKREARRVDKMKSVLGIYLKELRKAKRADLCSDYVERFTLWSRRVKTDWKAFPMLERLLSEAANEARNARNLEKEKGEA